MTMQIRADQVCEMIRSEIRVYEPDLLPLGNLSNSSIYENDTNGRMSKTIKMNIIYLYKILLFSTSVPPSAGSFLAF